MQVTYFDRLYVVGAEDFFDLNDDIQKDFVFQGSSNWDMYLKPTQYLSNTDSLENVALLSFENKTDFDLYLDKNKIVDYSIEHLNDLNRYLVLVQNG
jgi:hypothetical protein